MRLIPARAGNTQSAQRQQSQTPAHPRSRGEHTSESGPSSSGFGSSPLARGTQIMTSANGSPNRLIPARAGNTSKVDPMKPLTAAHPRSRGEH